MNQDELIDDNILISAVYPIRNVLMCEGGDSEDLVDDIIGNKETVVPGLKEFIAEGWKGHSYLDEDEMPEDFGGLKRMHQTEMLQEWAYRNVPGDLLVAAVSTPVPSYRKGSSGYAFSWEYSYTGLVSSTTLQGIYKAAAKWKKALYSEAKKEAA